MQGQRLPVPDLPHQMLMYSLGNCGFFFSPVKKRKKRHCRSHPASVAVLPSRQPETQIEVVRNDVWGSSSDSFSLFFFVQSTQCLMQCRFSSPDFFYSFCLVTDFYSCVWYQLKALITQSDLRIIKSAHL